MENSRRIEGLVDYIADRYSDAAEIGIGHFPDIAYALKHRGVNVFASDIRTIRFKGIRVIVDDITDPDHDVYRGRDLIYAMRPPPELVPYMVMLSRAVSADLILKPLSSEYAEGFRMVRNGNTTFFFKGKE